MIDIHSHILPGIDDGAKDLDEALNILAMQRASGVDTVYLTPHYYPEKKSLDTFLEERNRAWDALSVLPQLKEGPDILLGAEVRYCQELLHLDLRKLTLGESDYLLLEFPGQRYPAYAAQITEQLLGRGLIPVLAHVERCAYFRQEPELLKRLVEIGALAQVSASALFDRRDKNFSAACLRHGLAQIAASDAHNTSDRKPCLDFVRKLPEELQQLHEAFTSAILENEMPPYLRAGSVKKTIFGYR